MDHQDIALEIVEVALIEREMLTDSTLYSLQRVLAELVKIDVEDGSAFDPDSNEARTGLGFLHFKEQRFYSIKLGNAARDRMGSFGLGGAILSSGSGIATLVTTGAFSGWVGAAALVAIVLALVGRAKPFVSTLGLDEATALDFAWRLSRVEHGFRLIDLADLIVRLDEVETIYHNAGFNQAKLSNAINKLVAIGMIVEAGNGRYQLIEQIRVTGTNQLFISQT